MHVVPVFGNLIRKGKARVPVSMGRGIRRKKQAPRQREADTSKKEETAGTEKRRVFEGRTGTEDFPT